MRSLYEIRAPIARSFERSFFAVRSPSKSFSLAISSGVFRFLPVTHDFLSSFLAHFLLAFTFSLSPFVPFVTAHSAPLACLSLGLPFNLTLSSLSRRYLSFHFSSFYAGHLLRFFLAISENPLSED